MVLVEAGDFVYGTTPLEEDYFLVSQPNAQTINLPSFWIGKYEITNLEYSRFLLDEGYSNPAYWSEKGWEIKEQEGWIKPRRWEDRHYNDPRKRNHPVCALSWYEAQAYCNWLSAKTGQSYRLPAEREWEKAARGNNGRVFPWGNRWIENACNWLPDADHDRLPDNSVDGFDRTAHVSAFKNGISPYGCYNMSGNVVEWCSDRWSNKQDVRVYRGGCFLSGELRLLRCAWRGGAPAHIGHVYWGIIGFRVAMDAIKSSSTLSRLD